MSYNKGRFVAAFIRENVHAHVCFLHKWHSTGVSLLGKPVIGTDSKEAWDTSVSRDKGCERAPATKSNRVNV